MTYDYIIIGGGSAGCVLAARLSENPAARVLLVEAGGRDRHPFYHLPAGFAKMTKGIGSWGWQTVPQRHMKGMQIRYTQAKVIGGEEGLADRQGRKSASRGTATSPARRRTASAITS